MIPREPPPPALAHLSTALHELEVRGLLRVRPAPRPAAALSFCSNDYLGLAATGVGQSDASAPTGAGASRLVSGECRAHVDLERDVASWLQLPSALAFSSGYAANLGTIAALARPGDLVVSDEYNHASIIDGCRLSRARVVVTPHLDLGAVERALREARHPQGKAWVVTESYFSMDADSPDLARLREIASRHDAALVVDEAHALGVLGPDGRGLCAATGVVPDVLLGTFGKAFGHAGAFAAGCVDLTDWLWNRARSFVFSTGMSPRVAEGARAAVAFATAHPELRERVSCAAHALRDGLRGLDANILGHGHIIPWVVGDAAAAVRLAEGLQAVGIHVQAIRPPTVPAGGARLRMTVTARHHPDDIAHALTAVRRIAH